MGTVEGAVCSRHGRQVSVRESNVVVESATRFFCSANFTPARIYVCVSSLCIYLFIHSFIYLFSIQYITSNWNCNNYVSNKDIVGKRIRCKNVFVYFHKY